MKHALIIAHPKPASFTHSLAKAYAAAVGRCGHAVVIRDLYAMDFDPRLKASEVPDGGRYQAAPDTAAERALLADVDTFALFYPWWFNAPPAILKGYVDRVFAHGFGFRPVFGGMEPALTGRSLISFTVSGAPDHRVQSTGALNHLIALFDRHLCQMCGMTLRDHVHLAGVIPGMTPEAGREMIAQVEAAVARAFPAPDAAGRAAGRQPQAGA